MPVTISGNGPVTGITTIQNATVVNEKLNADGTVAITGNDPFFLMGA